MQRDTTKHFPQLPPHPLKPKAIQDLIPKKENLIAGVWGGSFSALAPEKGQILPVGRPNG